MPNFFPLRCWCDAIRSEPNSYTIVIPSACFCDLVRLTAAVDRLVTVVVVAVMVLVTSIIIIPQTDQKFFGVEHLSKHLLAYALLVFSFPLFVCCFLHIPFDVIGFLTFEIFSQSKIHLWPNEMNYAAELCHLFLPRIVVHFLHI